MKAWFTPRYRSVAVSVIGLLLTIAVLLLVISSQGLSERTIAASLLTLSFMVFTVSGVLFTGRTMLNWQIEDTSKHLLWERGLIVVSTLVTVLGLALLEHMLGAAGETTLARLGVTGYLFVAVLNVAAETTYISRREWNYPQITVYVIVGFLAQAAVGVSLLQTGLVAAWVGWAAVIWNVGFLLIMVIVRPKDIYYPVLHYVAPLLIGIALLVAV